MKKRRRIFYLDLSGRFKTLSPFARRVYEAVMRIPVGETRTYKWVAQEAGNPRAARAVGQLMKRNPYTLIIPCHRVTAGGGKPGGYSGSGGIAMKETLLEIEREIRACVSAGNVV